MIEHRKKFKYVISEISNKNKCVNCKYTNKLILNCLLCNTKGCEICIDLVDSQLCTNCLIKDSLQI